jgi:fructose-1,6-bisphosphatase I
MIKGGIYIYPTSSKAPKGKLRLLYECNQWLYCRAGGRKSIRRVGRIMEIQPTELRTGTVFSAAVTIWSKSRRVYVQRAT